MHIFLPFFIVHFFVNVLEKTFNRPTTEYISIPFYHNDNFNINGYTKIIFMRNTYLCKLSCVCMKPFSSPCPPRLCRHRRGATSWASLCRQSAASNRRCNVSATFAEATKWSFSSRRHSSSLHTSSARKWRQVCCNGIHIINHFADTNHTFVLQETMAITISEKTRIALKRFQQLSNNLS